MVNDSSPQELVERIIQVEREMRETVPPPRGAPFYGLDSGLGFGLETLRGLSDRGIFRKYEYVLLLKPGLGGAARWLATRLGCRILGVQPDVRLCAAAAQLSRRAHMSDSAHFVPGHFEALPLPAETFTHVWVLDANEECEPGLFAEAQRVMRRGGHFALEGEGDLTPLAPRCRAAGLMEIEIEPAKVEPIEHVVELARRRLQRTDATFESELMPRHRLFARRPS
jgi:hypothetical protein